MRKPSRKTPPNFPYYVPPGKNSTGSRTTKTNFAKAGRRRRSGFERGWKKVTLGVRGNSWALKTGGVFWVRKEVRIPRKRRINRSASPCFIGSMNSMTPSISNGTEIGRGGQTPPEFLYGATEFSGAGQTGPSRTERHYGAGSVGFAKKGVTFAGENPWESRA